MKLVTEVRRSKTISYAPVMFVFNGKHHNVHTNQLDILTCNTLLIVFQLFQCCDNISCCDDNMLGCFRITSIRYKINHLSEHSGNPPVAGAGSTHCAVHWAPPPDLLRSDVKSTFSPLFLPSLPCISSLIFRDLQNLQLKCIKCNI